MLESLSLTGFCVQEGSSICNTSAVNLVVAWWTFISQWKVLYRLCLWSNKQKMSSINLFHASGLCVFCLKVACSIFAITILRKATLLSCPLLFRVFEDTLQLHWIGFLEFSEDKHFFYKVRCCRRVLVRGILWMSRILKQCLPLVGFWCKG